MKNKLTNTVGDATSGNEDQIATYPIVLSGLREEDGGGFQATYPPLARSVVGYGPAKADALADLKAVTPLFLDVLANTGQCLPEYEPVKEPGNYSGKFNVRVPKVLHSQLVSLADEQGVSLNSLLQTLLTSGATALAVGKLFQPSVPLENSDTLSFCVQSFAVKT